jgi:hypothetical protein
VAQPLFFRLFEKNSIEKMNTHIFHILNGDCLEEQFPQEINGELIVARECLMEGDVSGHSLEEFCKNRAAYLSKKYPENTANYFLEVAPEFVKIKNIPTGATINLWFEEDLFCQVNMWFCAFLIKDKSAEYEINLVRPFTIDWRGFGALSPAELIQAYNVKKPLNTGAIELLADCWEAFKNDDLKLLKKLSFRDLTNFPLLPEVVQAHCDRFADDGKLGRPERVLLKIIKEYNTQQFVDVFRIFSKKEGIYGFGDLQVKSIFDHVLKMV